MLLQHVSEILSIRNTTRVDEGNQQHSQSASQLHSIKYDDHALAVNFPVSLSLSSSLGCSMFLYYFSLCCSQKSMGDIVVFIYFYLTNKVCTRLKRNEPALKSRFYCLCRPNVTWKGHRSTLPLCVADAIAYGDNFYAPHFIPCSARFCMGRKAWRQMSHAMSRERLFSTEKLIITIAFAATSATAALTWGICKETRKKNFKLIKCIFNCSGDLEECGPPSKCSVKDDR